MTQKCLRGVRYTLLLLPALCAASAFAQDRAAAPPILWGGHQELGLTLGYAPTASGPFYGDARDVRYSTAELRYSFLIRDGRHVQLRYAPVATLLATLRETTKSEVNPGAPVTHYGAGLSPASVQLTFLPQKRVQPFLSENGGFVYYNGRVLSPQGSQFMYIIDFGGGANLYTGPRNALFAGFRYMHSSNANISVHNPGTDVDLYYIGYSHFFTRGQK